MSSKHPSPRQGGSGSVAWVIAVVVLIVLAVGAIAVLARGGGDDADTATGATSPAGSNADGVTGPVAGDGTTAPVGQPVAIAPVKINGATLPRFSGGDADEAVGRAFPQITGQSVFDGAPVAITDDGRPKVVLFIAHWCPHCQKEVPLIQKWLDQHGKPSDVDLYAVSTGVAPSRGNYPPATWLTKAGWSVPTMADSADNDAFTVAGLTGYPSFVAVAGDGKVLARTSGELSIEEFTVLLDQAAGR
jgi:thiol-disulfide isomerase/thioredoxin